MLHPQIRLFDDEVISGKGLVTIGFIRAGEVVSRLEPNQPMRLIQDVATWSQEEQTALLHYSYQCSATHIVSEQGDERFMNHSCDPNTWWVDDDTMIARRDIHPGEEVRIMFDGWPSIIFSGWPIIDFGTFSGEVVAINRMISKNGKYRVLIAPAGEQDDWPEALRVGSGATGLALLKDVPIWYEIWRQVNGFPPNYYTQEDAMESKSKSK